MRAKPFLPVASAQARILAAVGRLGPLAAERVPLGEALGRALAAPVVARSPLPPFAASTMDGYAVRAEEVRRSGTRLRVAFEVFAGHPSPRRLPRGACARIFTGAPLPPGADAVEQQEHVTRDGEVAHFDRPSLAGRFVRPIGSDVRKGERAIDEGAALDAGALGLAASLGVARVAVRRRPRVAILPTGDELSPAGRRPPPGRIVESNGIALAAAAWEAGAEPLLLPPVPDELPALRRALRAARGCDAVVTVGGVSVGERDLVRAALSDVGAQIDFWRVAMRPGKPFAFGRWGGSAVFCLPGNPASALVTFELFVRPALRSLAGLEGSGRVLLPARLGERVRKPSELTVYLRARLRRSGRDLRAEPLPTQLSGNLSSAALVDALVVLPSGRRSVARGALVEAIVLRPPGGGTA